MRRMIPESQWKDVKQKANNSMQKTHVNQASIVIQKNDDTIDYLRPAGGLSIDSNMLRGKEYFRHILTITNNDIQNPIAFELIIIDSSNSTYYEGYTLDEILFSKLAILPCNYHDLSYTYIGFGTNGDDVRNVVLSNGSSISFISTSSFIVREDEEIEEL